MTIKIKFEPETSAYHAALMKQYGREGAMKRLRISRIIFDERTVNAVKKYKAKDAISRKNIVF